MSLSCEEFLIRDTVGFSDRKTAWMECLIRNSIYSVWVWFDAEPALELKFEKRVGLTLLS